jgi:hypothetical protein
MSRGSLSKIEKVFQEYSMKINKKNTTVLVCVRERTVADVRLKGERLEQVETFTYLGSNSTYDGRSTSDIMRRIAQAKTGFHGS